MYMGILYFSEVLNLNCISRKNEPAFSVLFLTIKLSNSQYIVSFCKASIQLLVNLEEKIV